MLYEERRIQLHRGKFGDYRRWFLNTVWPSLEEKGHRPLCLLNGLIGAPVETVELIVGYSDYDAWLDGQAIYTDGTSQSDLVNWIASESVKLLTASPYRPNETVPTDHRRPVYGMRRWWIRPEDWPEFNRLSFEGVWPAIDHMGHYVLGQFRDAATTNPLEILNLAGYFDPAHWQATRTPGEHGVPDHKLEKLRTLGARRADIVISSHVCLMSAHWIDR